MPLAEGTLKHGHPMHSPHEIVAACDTLRSLPAVYHRIREALEAPDSSLTDVARLVAHDGVIAGRVLQVVNSPLYGFSGQIGDIMRAVQILGMQQLHDIVLAMSLGKVFENVAPERMDMRTYWRLSVLRGLTARVTARRCGLLDAERLFIIGLLADLGHLVMYLTLPEKTDAAQQAADDTGEPLHLAEHRIIGADYAEVGCALMESWRLPRIFATVIGGQHTPVTAGDHWLEAAIINLTNRVADADRRGLSSDEATGSVNPAVWRQLDLPQSALPDIREEAELNLAAVIALFFPRLSR